MVQGFGVGLRWELLEALVDTTRAIDWLEVVAENWTGIGGLRRRQLEACNERWPIVPHGVSMSVAGTDSLDQGLFNAVSRLVGELDAPFWSEHIAAAVLGGTHFNDLLPVPASDAALEHVIARIRQASRMTDVPLVFENPTYYVDLPGRTMSDATFLSEIVRATGCGLLLDVNNVYVNSRNLGFDAERFIRALPLDRVVQLHIAGHTPDGDLLIDTHVGPVPDAVWALYRFTLREAGRPIPTLLEWDSEIPSLDRVVDELDRARVEAARALDALPFRASGHCDEARVAP